MYQFIGDPEYLFFLLKDLSELVESQTLLLTLLTVKVKMESHYA